MGVLVLRSSAVPATVADGATITRTGPSASLPTTVEFLGGSGGIIESGTNGVHFTRSGWSQLFASLSDWQYSTANPLSRTKTLRFDTAVTGDGRGTYFFDHGTSGVSEEYTSCNYYCDRGSATQMQWKVKRLMPNEDTTDATLPSWYVAAWYNGPGSFINHWSTGQSATDYLTSDIPTNTWVRVETWTVISNPAGTANGSIRVKVTNLSTGSTILDNTLSSIITRGSGDPVSRYHTMQNYLGNESPGGTRIFIDMEDIYISSVSSGSNAFVRAELCNNSVYANATVKRLCKVNSITGTDWNVTLNGPSAVFGTSNLSGLYLALHPASGTPTMALI